MIPLPHPHPNGIERSSVELACYDLLDRLSIPYSHLDHPPAATMQDCIEIDRRLGCAMCKNLFLTNKQKTRFFLLLMPADKPFRTADFSKIVASSRLSFASSEDMERLLGLSPGAVTLLGLMHDTNNEVTLCVDEELLTQDLIGIHPCVNTSSISLAVSDAFGPLIAAMHHEMTIVQLERRE